MRTVLALLAAATFLGCQGTQIVKNGMGPGYDVYRPHPYLVGRAVLEEVVRGEDRRIEAVAYEFQIVYLPDFSHRYRVEGASQGFNPLGLFGSDEDGFTLRIQDGWMLTTEVTGAGSDAFRELVSLARETVTSPRAADGVRDARSFEPVLYKIVISEERHVPTRLERVCIDDFCGTAGPGCLLPGMLVAPNGSAGTAPAARDVSDRPPAPATRVPEPPAPPRSTNESRTPSPPAPENGTETEFPEPPPAPPLPK